MRILPAAAATLLIASTAVAQSTRPATGRSVEPTTYPATQPSANQYTVLGGEGLEGVPLATAKGGPAVGEIEDGLVPAATFFGPMPTVFAFIEGERTERIFVAFPRWQDPTNFTVAELTADGLVPFPDAETNKFLPESPGEYDVKSHLVSVQSVVSDSQDRLWLLDTGSINLGPPIKGAPKLWGYDPATGERVAEIDFSNGDAIKEKTYLNDVRFDLSRGDAGYAFITDSGDGAIIVVDLATKRAFRKLDDHPSTEPQDVNLTVEGEPFPGKIASDGVALSPDGSTLYYTPLTGRTIYAVPVDALIDEQADAGSQVREVATKPSGNDGIVCDAQGRIYTTDFEDNAIRRVDPETGEVELIVQDERILWPDCVIVRNDVVYFTSNQLHRQPQFHDGQDMREQPYVLFGFPIPDGETPKPR